MSAFRHSTKRSIAATDRKRWAVRVLLACLAATVGICVAVFTQPSVQAPDARVPSGSINSAPAVAPLGGSAAIGQQGNASSAKNIYISPRFFGQHLMFFGLLTPDIPVHAMRLWDSNTGWCHIDRGSASDRFDFGQLDALLAQAARVGADVEYAFGNTPRWAADGSYPQSSVSDQCSTSSQAKAPADESYWKSFVTALATHAKGRIRAYELWNEFDLANYWSGDTMQMVRMSVDAASIIHRVDPSAVVLSPSVTDSPVGYATLNQYMSALPAGTIDAVAIHSYTNGQWPEDSVPAEMDAVRQALPAAYSQAPIWSTEGGWGKDSTFSTDASDQRALSLASTCSCLPREQ